MMQESVYGKLLLNSTATKTMNQKLDRNKPKKGLVQSLIITEKQFASISYIVGQKDLNVRDDANRIVII